MKRSELLKRIENRERLFVCQYAVFAAAPRTWRDKLTKKEMSAPTVKHTLLSSDGAIAVEEWLPDGTDLTQVKPPFKMGQNVVLHVESLERVNGSLSARGTISPLEDEVNSPAPARP